MHFVKHMWVGLLALTLSETSAQTHEFAAPSNANLRGSGQSYFDANVGAALLDGFVSRNQYVPLPGTSLLVGRRSFRSASIFLDAQVGWALPSLATAKLGVGHRNPSTGRSVAAGIRPWPAHAYIQFGREEKQLSDELKQRAIRRCQPFVKSPSDIVFSESILSIEFSAWFLESLWHGRDDERYRSDTSQFSMISACMVTWSRRWYLN